MKVVIGKGKDLATMTPAEEKNARMGVNIAYIEMQITRTLSLLQVYRFKSNTIPLEINILTQTLPITSPLCLIFSLYVIMF